MSQPTEYVKSAEFQQDEANAVAGRSTVRTSSLDAELAAIERTLTETLSNLELVQRDDGEIRDGKVKLHTLASDVLLLVGSGAFQINAAGVPWLTATAYVVGDLVSNGGYTYVCASAHTSGTFATDLAANKWLVVYGSVTSAASGVSFSPSGTIAGSTVQAAIEELNSETNAALLRLSQHTNGGLQ